MTKKSLVIVVTLLALAALAPARATCAAKAEDAATAAATPACPQCDSNAEVIPIVYGYPGEGLIKAAERGEVALGG